MSAPNFHDSLKNFSKELGLHDLQWAERPKQYFTQPLDDKVQATRIAHILADKLNLEVGNEDVGTVTSGSGGTRVIIWNIPRFTKALEVYQEKMNEAIGKMKDLAITNKPSSLPKESATFYDELEKFTGSRFDKIEWEKRPTQFVTQAMEKSEAKKIADTFIKDLNLPKNDEVIDVVDSAKGGSRAAIMNIPRFKKAFEAYQEKEEAQDLVNRFCKGLWSGEEVIIGQELENKFGISASSEIRIEPQGEGTYLLHIGNNYLPASAPDYWTEQKEISHDDIKYILSMLKNK